MSYFLNILNPEQRKVFDKLSFLNRDFYLAGGTALALQIGHRTSLDFDFYSDRHFDASDLYDKLEEVFREHVSQTAREKDTLFVRINNVDCSFFWYGHKLIEKPVIIEGIPVASFEDVAAMKLIAVSRRPAKRDYVDIYFLFQKFNLKEIFALAKRKYPDINLYYSLRALTYFDDVDESDKRPVKIFDKDFSWEKAKKKIFEEVKKYQLSMLKKD